VVLVGFDNRERTTLERLVHPKGFRVHESAKAQRST
jgi:hypothetical protein